MHPKEREKQHEQDCGGARLLLHEDEEKHKAIQYMTRHVKRHIMKRHMKSALRHAETGSVLVAQPWPRAEPVIAEPAETHEEAHEEAH